jgi:hypothetical protein
MRPQAKEATMMLPTIQHVATTVIALPRKDAGTTSAGSANTAGTLPPQPTPVRNRSRIMLSWLLDAANKSVNSPFMHIVAISTC